MAAKKKAKPKNPPLPKQRKGDGTHSANAAEWNTQTAYGAYEIVVGTDPKTKKKTGYKTGNIVKISNLTQFKIGDENRVQAVSYPASGNFMKPRYHVGPKNKVKVIPVPKKKKI